MDIIELKDNYEYLSNEYEDEIAAIKAAKKDVYPKQVHIRNGQFITNPKITKMERELEIAQLHHQYCERFFQELSQVVAAQKKSTAQA